jgi:hypothetical protein
MYEYLINAMDIANLTGEAIILLEFAFRLSLIVWMLSQRRIEPATRLSWIILLLAIPFLGAIIFLLIGENRFGRQRVRRHREVLAALDRPETHANADPSVNAAGRLEGPAHRMARLAEQVNGAGPVLGNRIELFGDTDLVLKGLERDIDAATEHCHLLFYLWLDDAAGTRIGRALVRAAARGVACRVLVDGVGSKDFLKSDLRREMEAGGVSVRAALPANAVRAIFARLDGKPEPRGSQLRAEAEVRTVGRLCGSDRRPGREGTPSPLRRGLVSRHRRDARRHAAHPHRREAGRYRGAGVRNGAELPEPGGDPGDPVPRPRGL